MTDKTNTAGQPNQDPLDAIRDVIRLRTYTETQKAINDTIRKEEDKVLSGNGKWGWIGKFLFAFAKWLGLEKNLASAVGMPIPEQREVRTIAGEVSEAVSQTMASKDAANMTVEQMQQAVAHNVTVYLKDPASRKNTPSLTDERIAEIAGKASAGAGKYYDQVHSFLNVNTELAKQLKQQIPLNSPIAQQLAKMAGKEKLESADLDVLAGVIGPQIKHLALNKDKLAAKGDGAYAEVSAQLKNVLDENKEFLRERGMRFTDNSTTALADQLAVPVTNKLLSHHNTMPLAFAKEMAAHKVAAINELLQDQVTRTTSEAVRQATIGGAIASYDAATLGWFYPNTDIKKYYSKNASGKYEPNAVRDDGDKEWLEAKWLAAAEKHGPAYERPQREKISEIVAAATTQTLNDPANSKLNREQLASTLSKNVYKALDTRQGEINGTGSAGHSVGDVNKGSGKDSLRLIADGIADKVNNDPAIYNQLASAQMALGEAKMVAAKDDVKNGSVSGGHEAATPAASAAFNPGVNPPDGRSHRRR